MELTRQQRDILDGKHGKGAAMAMRIQVSIGEGFMARRMLPVTRAHVALSAQEADVWFAEKLHNAGASCSVPPTVNPGYSLEYFSSSGLLTSEAASLMRRTHEVYRNLGAILTYSCTPYLFGNIPRHNEVVSFSETSVTVYANSVLGARTHRESAASSLCAAITGYVPEYGMLLDENRFGDVLVTVETSVSSDFEFALLGLTGAKIGGGVPVFQRLPPHMSTEALIALGTQLNVSGVCDKYHITGVTPDARTAEEAMGGKAPKRRVTIVDEDMERVLAQFSPAPGRKIEFVMLGCPHYTYEQVARVAALLRGRKAAAAIWVLTSSAVKYLAVRMGLAEELAALGVFLVADTCVDQKACFGGMAGVGGATDSPKCAYYMGTFGVELAVRDIETCIRWALHGRSE